MAQEIKYSEYFVAFLDVLGFKKLVFSERQEDKDKIEEYFRLIEDLIQDLKMIEGKEDIGAIVISDSIILSVPKSADSEENIDKLRQFCIAIQKIQFGLALKNIWLRGAISSGQAYFNAKENQIVGKAYINAYLLEERSAIYPRVILDNKLINELGFESASELISMVNPDDLDEDYIPKNGTYSKTNFFYDWPGSYISGHELKKDIALFIDYLALFYKEPRSLTKIVDNIEQNIYSDNEIYSKFIWVSDYLKMKCLGHHARKMARQGIVTLEDQARLIDKQIERLSGF